MDPKVFAHSRYPKIAAACAWRGGSPAYLAAWQRRARARLRRVIGLPGASERCPLDARVTETVRLRGYTRETVTFVVRPGLRAFGYFLKPEGASSRRPAVLCLPGHGRGVDSIVGIAEDGSQRELDSPDEYQKDFALQCVAHGYPTFAIEQVSFGHRADAQAREAGPGNASCTRDSMAALMMGESMIGWRVWDAMRAIDYMRTRREVDPHRIATMGISGGGCTSLWAACCDTRVKFAVVSGYFNTFRNSILAMDHCVDNFASGVLRVMEMPDMAGLVAPRALFAESGTNDSIFPLPAFHEAVARATEIYTAFGVPERFGHEVFEGEHQFHGVGAFAFMVRAL
jgi:dienelactone hydrolase